MMDVKLKIKQLTETAKVPTYAHANDAGMDLYADEAVVIQAGHRVGVKTGIAFAIPEGSVGLIWDKSGLALNKGITVLGGVIDAGYRGEVVVILLNTSSEVVTFNPGDKVAQMVIQTRHQYAAEVVENLDETERGEGGFGSTGAQ